MRALGLLCAALLVSAAAAAQIDPKTALLERAGWDAIAAGRAQDAASAFRQAIAGDPRNPRLYLGAGTAAFLDRRDADARGALERALELNPNLTQARTLLGQVLYRTGDLAGAIRVYEALVVQAPADAQVHATLDKWRREAELNDRLERTLDAHFTVSFEGPEQAALAAEALAALDRAYWRIGAVLATYPASPINVVLYTSEQFRDITRSPSWAAGAYDGTIRVPMRGALDDPKELDRVLAHEFTHALIRGIAPRGVPTWLNEGLATALETGDLGWAESRVLQAHGPAAIASLQTSFARMTGDQAQLAYASSALAARRLLADAGGVAVMNLLRDLSDGAPFDNAFEHRILRSFTDFAESLQ